MSPIGSIIPTPAQPLVASAQDAVSALPTKTLNQQDFLRLLVTQLSSQDPLNPQSNADFAAQMAQFSALQSAQSTSAGISQVLAGQQVEQANSLIGRSVSVAVGNGMVTGTVSAVHMTNMGPGIIVNGNLYDLSQVVAIQPPPPTVTH